MAAKRNLANISATTPVVPTLLRKCSGASRSSACLHLFAKSTHLTRSLKAFPPVRSTLPSACRFRGTIFVRKSNAGKKFSLACSVKANSVYGLPAGPVLRMGTFTSLPLAFLTYIALPAKRASTSLPSTQEISSPGTVLY